MKPARDLSRAQYVAAMQRHGFKADIMGFWTLPVPGVSISISDWNAGDRRRDKLAYMIGELEKKRKG